MLLSGMLVAFNDDVSLGERAVRKGQLLVPSPTGAPFWSEGQRAAGLE